MADFLICQRGARFTVALKGRTAWALRELMVAGAEGCTPIENPAPRWSAYIFNLRRAGLDIETIHEAHRGAYPGHHARYVLHADVVDLEPCDGE
jgi:hypothetical protein